MIIEGPRVRLRPLTRDDRQRAQEILSTPEVARWWGETVHEVERLLEEEAGFSSYAIELDGEVVGLIQSCEELDPQYRHAGIDIAVAPSHHGRGLGPEAIRVLAAHLFAQGHHRLTIDPAAANDKAVHVYTKLGFRPVGLLRQYERGPDGTFHDGLLMDLLEGELR
ncbi:GNAT family N-acetyltransferase [Amycolatopsis sp. NPDC001319]|uniref:GNAT family N-acetyltransferase n=1 Tax=unclassified Amycolatopsis TaxID=2618356 RepID=UPI0036B1959D